MQPGLVGFATIFNYDNDKKAIMGLVGLGKGG